MSSFFRRNRSLLVTTFLIGIPTGMYVVSRLHESGFRDGLMSNLAATILGVVVGIPIALKLNESQSRQQEVIQHSMDEARRSQVLLLLEEELCKCATQISARRDGDGGKWSVEVPTIQVSLWHTFTESGDLRYVNDPVLLHVMAEAYHCVEGIRLLERKVLDVLFFPGLQVKQAVSADERIRGSLVELAPEALSLIEVAVAQIRATRSGEPGTAFEPRAKAYRAPSGS